MQIAPTVILMAPNILDALQLYWVGGRAKSNTGWLVPALTLVSIIERVTIEKNYN